MNRAHETAEHSAMTIRHDFQQAFADLLRGRNADRKGKPTPGLLDDLEVAVRRQARLESSAGGGSGSPTVVFNIGAAQARDLIKSVLQAMKTSVDLDLGRPAVYEADPAKLVEAILHHARWLSDHPKARDWHHELLKRMDQALILIDREEDYIHLGPCQSVNDAGHVCEAAILTIPKAGVATCSVCGAQYEVQERMEQFRAVRDDLVAPLPVISRALAGLGYDITLDRVKKWRQRGLLVSCLDDGAHGYRVGDVLTVWQRMQARKVRVSA